MEELKTSAGSGIDLQDLSEIQRELMTVPYSGSDYNEDVAPIGGTQVFNLYAVDNLENRIPILKTVVIRTATLSEIIDALVKSDQFHDFFEETLLDGQWLRYSTEPPYIMDEFQPNTLYFNVANIDIGTSAPGVVDSPYEPIVQSNTARQSQSRKITLTCLVDGNVSYLPIIKGSTWEQIKDKIEEPDYRSIPMKKFSHWSLTEDGSEIPDLKTFDASTVIYAVLVDNTVTVKVNGLKYPFKTQVNTKFMYFKSRISLPVTKRLLGYSLEPNGDLVSDDYRIDTPVTFYPVFEV